MNNLEKEAVAPEYGKNVTPIITAKGEAELADIIIQEAKSKVYILRKTQNYYQHWHNWI